MAETRTFEERWEAAVSGVRETLSLRPKKPLIRPSAGKMPSEAETAFCAALGASPAKGGATVPAPSPPPAPGG